MVELPYPIGSQQITDVLYNKKCSLESSIPYALYNFIQLTLHNSENKDLVLKDLISHPKEILDVSHTKKNALMSTPVSYYSSQKQDPALPLYRLNLVTSEPEGGVYKIGLQFGTIDAGQRSDYSTPVKRDLTAEAHLAQELTDLFQAVANYGQPQLNK